jgi:hypothetical protein
MQAQQNKHQSRTPVSSPVGRRSRWTTDTKHYRGEDRKTRSFLRSWDLPPSLRCRNSRARLKSGADTKQQSRAPGRVAHFPQTWFCYRINCYSPLVDAQSDKEIRIHARTGFEYSVAEENYLPDTERYTARVPLALWLQSKSLTRCSPNRRFTAMPGASCRVDTRARESSWASAESK